MSTDKVSNAARERANEILDNLEPTLASVETTVTNAATEASETAQLLALEAQEKAESTVKFVETYVREKPLQAAGIAFAAGVLTALVLGVYANPKARVFAAVKF